MITEVQLRLSPKDASDAGTVKNAAARAAGVKHSGVNAVQVLRRSIDARGRNVTIQMSAVVFSGSVFPEKTPPAEYPDVSGKEEIIIVGSGPAGMFAALKAIENGYRPIVLERGKDVRERRRDLRAISVDHTVNPDSNYCFGEGGAGRETVPAFEKTRRCRRRTPPSGRERSFGGNNNRRPPAYRD